MCGTQEIPAEVSAEARVVSEDGLASAVEAAAPVPQPAAAALGSNAHLVAASNLAECFTDGLAPSAQAAAPVALPAATSRTSKGGLDAASDPAEYFTAEEEEQVKASPSVSPSVAAAVTGVARESSQGEAGAMPPVASKPAQAHHHRKKKGRKGRH